MDRPELLRVRKLLTNLCYRFLTRDSGLRRITLKVRIDNPKDVWRTFSPHLAVQGCGETTREVISPDGLSSTLIMRHLLDIFMSHFGCQFPFLDRQSLESKIEARTGSVFLLNSIAAIAARCVTPINPSTS